MTTDVARAAELERERATLARANRDIADGQARLGRQQDIIERMRTRGQDCREAECLFDILVDTLAQWERHRELILARIATLEQPAG